MIKRSILTALVAAGISATSEPAAIKKAYFTHTNQPASKAKLEELLKALGGDETVIESDETPAPAAKAKAEKAPKEPKAAKEPKAPTAPKAVETPEAALARLKADPKTSERWKRVTEVLEMGKKGPTRVRILCDDKGTEGQDLFRDIAVQDVFQVKFSAGYKKPRKARPAAVPATEPAAQ